MHIYQSQGWKCGWPLCHITLCTHEYDHMGCVLPRWLVQNDAAREANPHWMPLSLQMLWLVHPSFAFPAHGQLGPQSRQNRNLSVIRSSRQKQLWWMRPAGPPRPQQWPTPEILLWKCCWVSGIDLKKKNLKNMWDYYCCSIKIALQRQFYQRLSRCESP